MNEIHNVFELKCPLCRVRFRNEREREKNHKPKITKMSQREKSKCFATEIRKKKRTRTWHRPHFIYTFHSYHYLYRAHTLRSTSTRAQQTTMAALRGGSGYICSTSECVPMANTIRVEFASSWIVALFLYSPIIYCFCLFLNLSFFLSLSPLIAKIELAGELLVSASIYPFGIVRTRSPLIFACICALLHRIFHTQSVSASERIWFPQFFLIALPFFVGNE